MDFQHSFRQQQQQINGGLTRYRSAPSSYFNSFLHNSFDTISGSCGVGAGGGGVGAGAGHGVDDLDHFLSKYMPNNQINAQREDSNLGDNFSNSMSMQSQSQFVASMKQEPDTIQPQQLQRQNSQTDYSSIPEMMFQNQAQAQVQVQSQRHHNPEVSDTSSMENSYRLLSSMNSNRTTPMKLASGGVNSNLIRYNSSPAGLFANINIENEYGAMRGMGNFGAGNNANAEASFPSASGFRGFSSGQTSSGLMSSISEIETKGMGDSNASDRDFRDGNRNDGSYLAGFPVSSWDESAMLSDNFLKGLEENDNKTFFNLVPSENQFGDQNNEGQNDPPTPLSRHLSLPRTSAELSAMETLMQDSVLCKIRAKRGCATHPRSIAERVRRTKISERMRKLQELVPNMDKQANTSDMLDLAVDYIKDLQKQVKALSDNRAKCTCSDQ